MGWAATLAALSCGCNVFPLAPTTPPERAEAESLPGLPAKHQVRVAQFVFFSNFEISRTQPLFKELGALRDQVERELKLPSSSRVVFVYLFEDRERFERFMEVKHPDLPKRRAFFVAQERRLGGAEDLLVYTYWGDRVAQDLRHELTHAVLHSVLKDVPIWLDEGLAECYEVPSSSKGVNQAHLDQLLRGPTGPPKFDLDRLEGLSKVQHMSPVEYRESWAWAHWMLHGNTKARKELIAYLTELRTNPKPGPLRPRLMRAIPDCNAQVEKHIRHLDAGRSKRS